MNPGYICHTNNLLSKKKGYFSYLEPLSKSERDSKEYIVPRRRRYSDITPYKPVTHPIEWKCSWSSYPKLFSQVPANLSEGNIYRRRKKRMLVRDERLALLVYKIIHSIHLHPVKYKWMKIIKLFQNKKTYIDFIFDKVVNNFNYRNQITRRKTLAPIKYSY